MKKLMIAACAMAMAVAAQAANVTWASAPVVFEAGSTTTRLSSGLSAYLISASDWSRTQLLTAFTESGVGASAFASSSAWKSAAQIKSTTTSANGKIKSITDTSTVLPSEAGTKSAYFVIVNGDNLYLSDELQNAWVSVGDKYTFSFTSDESPVLAGQQALMDRSKGLQGEYNGAGWYGAAVPEPTSAMLLLLGVAGLALRRRRA